MGTVVYQQGFQSQLNEPRALRLRLSSPNPHFFQPFGLALKSHALDSSKAEDIRNRNDDKPVVSSGPDSSGWSFLQSLSSGSSSTKTTSSEKEKTYVQRPSSCRTLSDQSLALCTENLGSESGSDVTDVEDLFSLDVQTKNLGETTTETRTLKSRKRNVSPSDIPPPLTTMRGFQCIQMRPHRENGRLVMTATNEPPRNRCFQADRSNGRLRLSILKDSDEFVENEEETIEPEGTEEYEEEKEEGEEEEEEEEEYDELKGIENVQRSRRCVEGDRENRGLLNRESFFFEIENRESFCVATS